MISCLVLAVVALTAALLQAQDGAGQPIPVVLIGGQNNHDWQKSNAFLMALLGRQSNISVVENDSPPDNASKEAWAAWAVDFSKYRCVLLNYNGQMWPDALRTAFEKYLADGGTAIVLHAANTLRCSKPSRRQYRARARRQIRRGLEQCRVEQDRQRIIVRRRCLLGGLLLTLASSLRRPRPESSPIMQHSP